MDQPILIRKGTPKDHGSCIIIISSLPEYFNRAALENVADTIYAYTLYVATLDDKVVGFCQVNSFKVVVAEIRWMAISPHFRGQGIGTLLLEQVFSDLKMTGFRRIEVKTLAESAEYAPYAKTRAFYEKNGFELKSILDPYKPWGEGNPCAIYEKIL